MKELTDDDILDLPVHDSDFLKLTILPNGNGETDIILEITFYKGEWEDLPEDFLEILDAQGRAAFLFKNCGHINLQAYRGGLPRDLFDMIRIDTKKDAYNNVIRHVEVLFISGSKLDCSAENVVLVRANTEY